MHRCLRDAIYDEGLAVRFSLEATPQTNLLEALFMSEAQIEWLQTNWRALLADRERRGVLDEVSPSLELVGDALYFDPARTKPPFSIERPPAKWGYYLGLQWAHAAGGSWTTRLSSEPPRMGRHA